MNKIKRGKNKKGAISHVEVIISFVVFVSLITFLLVMFKPLKIFARSSSALDITESVILGNISTELNISSVKIDKTVADGTDCLILDSLPAELSNARIIVKNATETKVNAQFTTPQLNVKYSGDFYRIYLSEEFPENPEAFTCDSSSINLDPNKKEYTPGVFRTYEVSSNSSLYRLFERYSADYKKLKEEIGLKNEFVISVRNNRGRILPLTEEQRYKPKGIEIMARDVPIEVLNSEEELEPYILNVQVWD